MRFELQPAEMGLATTLRGGGSAFDWNVEEKRNLKQQHTIQHYITFELERPKAFLEEFAGHIGKKATSGVVASNICRVVSWDRRKDACNASPPAQSYDKNDQVLCVVLCPARDRKISFSFDIGCSRTAFLPFLIPSRTFLRGSQCWSTCVLHLLPEDCPQPKQVMRIGHGILHHLLTERPACDCPQTSHVQLVTTS